MEKYKGVEGVACVLSSGKDIANRLYVLLQEHPEGKKRPRKNPLQYTVLAGTKEKDESYIQSVIRETKEETGRDIKNPKYIGEFGLELGDIVLPVKIFDKNIKPSSELIIRPEFESEISGGVFEDIFQILEKPIEDIRPGTLEAIYLSLGGKFENLYLVKIENGKYTLSQFSYIKKLIEKQLGSISNSADHS